MTGPEHYREAERYLGSLRGRERSYETKEGEESIVAEAQVHAILALTAATALASNAPDLRAWREVAGTKTSG